MSDINSYPSFDNSAARPRRDTGSAHEYWGTKVPDPYQYMGVREAITEPEYIAWREAEKKHVESRISGSKERTEQIEKIIAPFETSPLPLIAAPIGDKWFRVDRSPSQYDHLELAASKNGPWEVFKQIGKGHAGDFIASPDGKWLAYKSRDLLGDGGHMRFVDMATKRPFDAATQAILLTGMDNIAASLNERKLKIDLGHSFSWGVDSERYYVIDVDGTRVIERPLTRIVDVTAEGPDAGITYEMPPN
ncbi:MAG: hypothetical protein AB7H77_11205, partial [Bdellovibrionales bacterium]